MNESEKKVLRVKLVCPHSSNALFCAKCRYNPKRFLSKWENISTSRL